MCLLVVYLYKYIKKGNFGDVNMKNRFHSSFLQKDFYLWTKTSQVQIH